MSEGSRTVHDGPVTDVQQLKEQVRMLARLEPGEAPVLSCYLAVSGTTEYRYFLDERLKLLCSTFSGQRLIEAQEAAGRIREFLHCELSPRADGVAVFARGGCRPFFLPLQFGVAMPSSIVADAVPHVYSLIEFQQIYGRYCVLLFTPSISRIVGVDLGSVRYQTRIARAELFRHSGEPTTGQNRQERAQQFTGEVVRKLEHAMAEEGFEHLVLAGSPPDIARIDSALPQAIKGKVVDIVYAAPSGPLADLVRSTLRCYVDYADGEKQVELNELISQISLHGPAVSGVSGCMRALMDGKGALLFLSRDVDLGLGWECRKCGAVETGGEITDECPACHSHKLRTFDVKEELVRIAARSECRVDIVKHSDGLSKLGGAGCLLLSVAPGNSVSKAA